MTPSCVLHIPHSSTVIPRDIRDHLRISEDRLGKELLVMTDWYTDEIYALAPWEAVAIRFPASRLVLDPERYLDDGLEVMASRGMGLIYIRDSGGGILRDAPDPECRPALISRFYEPHHSSLAQAAQTALDLHGRCLVMDCHSFPSRPLPCDLDRAPDRPDVCVGTVPSHTPCWLAAVAVEFFDGAGFTVEVDQPYSGALVPARHSGRNPSVSALMLEMNRRLYLDERSGEKLPSFPEFSDAIRGLLRRVIQAWQSQEAA